MAEERPAGVHARRRDRRSAQLPPPFDGPPQFDAPPSFDAPPPFDASQPLGPPASPRPHRSPSDPTTQELELYRHDPGPPAARLFPEASALDLRPGNPRPADRGERARAFVERWSLWAAGLGKPPRDRSGRRRYPGREGLLPPALLLAAALGVAALLGLLTGLLLSPSSGDAAAASATPPTVTVTRQVTPPVVTETRTRTRTRTVTATEQAQAPDPGTVLQPGSQGPAVLQLQQDLAGLELYQGQPTGSYDEETRAGVQAFQGGFGVTADPPGVAGPATLAAVARAVGRA